MKNEEGSWDVELGINNLGNRFLPMKIKTYFSDGTSNNRWWDRHLWRFQDTLRYTTNKQPVKVVMDPEVQTLDMDLRNNSTKMKKTISLIGLEYGTILAMRWYTGGHQISILIRMVLILPLA